MKIFYHLADADGKCSGFLVDRYAEHFDKYKVEFCGINYGMDFPFDKIQRDEQVFIVDYSIFPEEMDKLLEITSNVVWIDHHKSSIQRYENYDKEIAGIRYDGIAGCALTFCYLTLMTLGGNVKVKPFDVEMVKELPKFIALIADYDVWTFEFGDETRNFHSGLMLNTHNPWDDIWSALYANPIVNGLIEDGKIAKLARASMMKDYCEAKGFEATLNGYKVFAINMAMVSSDDFESVDASKYDLFVGFSFDGKTWNYSLRSTKVDCSEIAMSYGGGGHVGAAGFNSNEFVLKLIDEEVK